MITFLSYARRRRARTSVVLRSAGLVAGLVVVAASVPVHAAAAEPSVPQTVVAVDATQHAGTVDKAVLGQAYLWPFAGMGSFDESSGQFYSSFTDQLQDVVEPGSLRYPGGITAEAFHWQRAVGPQATRTLNAFGPSSGPSASSVGPDEFGELLDRTGADGVVTTDFGTGSAQEAAAFVAYMTGPPGSSAWADMRVRDGHRAAYRVPYWEVGNEEYSANYWRSGTPVAVGGPTGACQDVPTCLYIYGGSTGFAKQPVVLYADRTAAASHSTGSAGQAFYAAYPPVAAGSSTVYVGGTAWTEVGSLASAGPADDVYAIDDASGKITFGDGVHGAVPPSGAQITLSYVSGPHDGFLDFYRAMKTAEPSIRVCSSDTTTDFIASMGSTLPYDCLQDHTYTSVTTVANDVPLAEYQDQMMAGADAEANGVARLQATIRRYAGRDVPLVETEYGQLLSSNPDADPYYHESLDQALLNATQLSNWIRLGIPVADRQLLAAEIPPASQCCAGLPGAAPFASTASIGTPGPNTVAEATGELYKLFAPLAGGSVLGVQTVNDPVLPNATSTAAPALSVLAVRRSGYVYLVGINRSTTDEVSTRVLLKGVRAAGLAHYTRLDGRSSLSYNTAAEPDAVKVTAGAMPAAGRAVDVSFPAHSVTTLRLPVRSAAVPPLTVGLSAQPDPVAPGSQVSLRASVGNGEPRAATAQVVPVVPAGWAVAPASAPVRVPGHGETDVVFRVNIPDRTAEARYQLGAIAYAPGSAVADVTTTNTIVRDLHAWTNVVSDGFEDQQAGAPPGDYTVTGPAGGITVQAAPSGTGQVLQVQRATSKTPLVAADRAFPPTPGTSRFVFRAWAAQTNTALGVQLLDGSGSPVVKLSLATAGDVAWSDPADFVRGASYTAGRWYTYELDLDPGAGTYKLYIDDILTATAALNTAAGAPADIHLQMPSSPSTPGTFDLDDISFAVPATS